MANAFYTIGHSKLSVAEFAALLESAGADFVVDVRAFPRSRSNPQFNADALPPALAAHGIGYEHVLALGGRRGRQAEVPPERNALWTNGSFHNYADYAEGAAFRVGFDRLVALGRSRPCAIMCAEAVWWRCHRRIVADYLIARGERVLHIMPDGRIAPAKPTPGARPCPDGTLVYPPASLRGA
ncbi:MAG: DUF488 domain-containing protein [Hyphomicrobiales bacterium]|nr:DUF488 domain-containing protein [Hyphomicrobiales bacterium]MBV9429084.1 DUF488 domain-containing protein [Bradyrhizobiaceae bacterium]